MKTKPLTSIFFILLFWSTNVSGQKVFASIDAIIDSIESKTTDLELNHFLAQCDMASFSTDFPHDTFAFAVDKIEVDIFKKNLFGSDEEEIVLQLRQQDINFVNIFYKTGKEKVVKVPGFIHHLRNIYSGYFDESFLFYFENIASPGLHSIITKSKYSYNRHSERKVTIWDVGPDSIREVYSTLIYYHSMSPIGWRNHYKTVRTVEFQDGSFPKPLIMEEETINYEDLEITQEGDTLSGYKTFRRGLIHLNFDYGESGLTIRKSEDQTVETKIELKKKK